MGAAVKDVRERFLEKVKLDPETGCWVWQGSLRRDGYGRVCWQRQTALAHRVSRVLFCGEIPSGLSVLHKCDVRACCNPEHLFLGNQLDNMRDCAAKGRNASQRYPGIQRGSRNGHAKLDEERVKDIRAARARGETLTQIARDYGVSAALVSHVVRRKLWGHVE